jgi:hypothetical protein
MTEHTVTEVPAQEQGNRMALTLGIEPGFTVERFCVKVRIMSIVTSRRVVVPSSTARKLGI